LRQVSELAKTEFSRAEIIGEGKHPGVYRSSGERS
jgi:hypothetical protein